MESAAVLILASASPRRSQLLRQIGVPHRVVPAQIDERAAAGEAAADYVQRLARHKALQVQRALQGQPQAALPVLGADTVVELERELLGKPRDRGAALAMLARLSDRQHRVWSGVALALADRVEIALSRSEVQFRALTRQECERYWDSGEAADKAGAYAIQGFGAVFVQQLRGSYSGVVGLPLAETAMLLARAGISLWQQGAAGARSE